MDIVRTFLIFFNDDFRKLKISKNLKCPEIGNYTDCQTGFSV